MFCVFGVNLCLCLKVLLHELMCLDSLLTFFSSGHWEQVMRFQWYFSTYYVLFIVSNLKKTNNMILFQKIDQIIFRIENQVPLRGIIARCLF